MAYSNYGAFVYCNGERRMDKEDCKLFEESEIESWADYCHGAMGDGDIRVKCYKKYLPKIYERQPDGSIIKVLCCDENSPEYDEVKFDVVFEYKGYRFEFVSDKPCRAIMIEPDGTTWECDYDYCYGSG